MALLTTKPGGAADVSMATDSSSPILPPPASSPSPKKPAAAVPAESVVPDESADSSVHAELASIAAAPSAPAHTLGAHGKAPPIVEDTAFLEDDLA